MLIQTSAATLAEEPELTPEELADQPPPERGRRARKIALGAGVLLLVLVLILALTAPLSKSLKPLTAPSVTLLSAEGRPIARKGSVTDLPVDARQLPSHVPQAFLAIEDRRFYEHLGVDPWGIARAGIRNLLAGGVVEGGSTISQQLAKLAFLSSDQTAARKVQEAILALWLETWLSKDEILSRYLSSVYFGDNVYGLRAAANHYFSRKPEELTVEQAAMLAGLIKAPSSLAPTSNLKGARARGEVVVNAMVDAGYLDEEAAEELPVVKLNRGPVKDVPNGTYFADWIFKELGQSEPRYGEQRIQTTLEDRMQRQAARAIRGAGIGGAQVALVSMRADGRVVAMVGGRSYRQSPFNRVTQAKRQSGSTFKLFVYLAAMRAGYSPNDMIEDRPIRIGNWTPENYEGKYRGVLPLRDAFAFSSNVAAVRLAQQVGREKVVQAARDLGVTSELEPGPTIALGTSAMTLMEMTSAFAAIAKGSYPVKPSGLPEAVGEGGSPFEGSVRDNMLQLLGAVTNHGTGRAAKLPFQTFGKTGTTQGNRDAYFIGFAGDLVTGVWIGRDDNQPVGDVQGGGIPAVIWRNFMSEAVKAAPATPAAVPEAEVARGETLPPAPYGTVQPQQDYYVGEYDVEDSGADVVPPPGEGGAVPQGYVEDGEEEEWEDEAGPAEGRPVEIAPPPPPDASRAPRDNAPPRRRREPPTLSAPPPPPEPEDEGAAEEEEE
ncbi:MAG: transglycosylase domain-containing protein [Pseudomonadota bacterium]|nr:transglycosylase domain-containing protein [Pseudomonadota bacterium]